MGKGDKKTRRGKLFSGSYRRAQAQEKKAFIQCCKHYKKSSCSGRGSQKLQKPKHLQTQARTRTRYLKHPLQLLKKPSRLRIRQLRKKQLQSGRIPSCSRRNEAAKHLLQRKPSLLLTKLSLLSKRLLRQKKRKLLPRKLRLRSPLIKNLQPRNLQPKNLQLKSLQLKNPRTIPLRRRKSIK